MSSRTNSGFGNLGERLRKPTTPYVLVDNQHPGLIIEWVLREEWHARVAWLDQSDLRIGELPANRLTPHTVAAKEPGPTQDPAAGQRHTDVHGTGGVRQGDAAGSLA